MADIKYPEPTSTPENTVLRNVAHDSVNGRDYQIVKLFDGTAVSNAAGTQVDGHSATLGSTTDPDTAFTTVGLLKKLISLLSLRFPPLLGPNGGTKVELWSPTPAGTNNIGDVDVVSVIPGTTATSLGKAEGAAHVSGDTGVLALGVRADTPIAFGPDGSNVPPQFDAAGNLRTASAGDALGDLTNYSGTITAVDGSHVIKAAVSTQRHLYFQNAAVNEGVEMWIRPGGANASAGQGSFRVLPGEPFELHGPGARQEWRVFCEQLTAPYTTYGG